MSVRAARLVVFGILLLYAIFLTWPGLVPFNRIHPLVLGLPFVLFWIVLWILIIGAGFGLLYAAESRAAAAVMGATGGAATGTGDATPGEG